MRNVNEKKKIFLTCGKYDRVFRTHFTSELGESSWSVYEYSKLRINNVNKVNEVFKKC